MKTQLSVRPGGALTKKFLPQPDGSTLTQIQVELTKLPAPDRNYVADAVGVRATEAGFRLLFAQEKASGELRSLLIVNVAPESMRTFRDSCGTFWPGLDEFLKRNQVESGSLIVDSVEPPQVVVLRANLIAASYSGREAELQFFHLAPFSVHKMRIANEDPAIDAVVRIDLSTTKLHGMLQALMNAPLPEDWK